MGRRSTPSVWVGDLGLAQKLQTSEPPLELLCSLRRNKYSILCAPPQHVVQRTDPWCAREIEAAPPLLRGEHLVSPQHHLRLGIPPNNMRGHAPNVHRRNDALLNRVGSSRSLSVENLVS